MSEAETLSELVAAALDTLDLQVDKDLVESTVQRLHTMMDDPHADEGALDLAIEHLLAGLVLLVAAHEESRTPQARKSLSRLAMDHVREAGEGVERCQSPTPSGTLGPN